MEQITDITLDNILVLAKDIIKTYCEENEIENEKEIHPSTWCDVLDVIHDLLITDGRILKTSTNKNNQYDTEKVIYLYNKVYVRLCNIYIQEISQKDFLILSGIDKQSLYNWSSGDKLSSTGFDFIGKINEDNEASIWHLMRGDKGNPNKYFGKLNRYHGWNGAGTTSERAEKKTASLEDVQRRVLELSQNKPQLPDNSQ